MADQSNPLIPGAKMPAPPRLNKLVYSEGLNTTYILSPDGKTQLGYMEGDHRNNPAAQMATSPQEGFNAPLKAEDIPNHIRQAGNDFVVNAASMAPLMIPGLGPGASLGARALLTAGRVGGSLAASYGTDSALNPEKSSSDKMSEALFNTVGGLIFPEILNLLKGGSKLKMEWPGQLKETTKNVYRNPTTMSRETVNTGNSVNSGTASGSGNSRTASEGITSGKGATKTSGTQSAVGENSNTLERTAITRQFEDDIPDTPHMEALKAEIDRLKALEPKNQGQATQINNAIARNSDAYDSAAELNSGGGRITKTTGSGTGRSASEGQRSGESTNTQESTTNNKSNNSSQTQSTHKGESNFNGNTKTTGTTLHGDTTEVSATKTTGHTFAERLGEALVKSKYIHVKDLTGIQKFISGVLGNEFADIVSPSGKK